MDCTPRALAASEHCTLQPLTRDGLISCTPIGLPYAFRGRTGSSQTSHPSPCKPCTLCVTLCPRPRLVFGLARVIKPKCMFFTPGPAPSQAREVETEGRSRPEVLSFSALTLTRSSAEKYTRRFNVTPCHQTSSYVPCQPRLGQRSKLRSLAQASKERSCQNFGTIPALT